MSRFQFIATAIAAAFWVAGCRAKEDDKSAAPPPPEVTISKVIEQDVTDSEVFTGRTESVEMVEVRSRVNGYLTEIHFTDGQEVDEGEALFQVDSRPFQANLEYAEGQKAQWEATAARAAADVERYEKLVPTGAATPQDLDKANADLGEAKAAIKSAQATIDLARLDLEFAAITAPIAGQISRALITKGNLVRANLDLLTTVVSMDPIYVYFDVSERDLLRFRERARSAASSQDAQPGIREVKMPIQLGLAGEKGFPHDGVLDFAENRVDANTGTISVRARLDNSKRIFKPGLFARVRVPTSDTYKALLVSERAIGIDQGMRFVLTVDEKNIVKQQFVELGPLQDDGLRVIVSGLKPETWVVVNGLQRARPGQPVTPQRAEMPQFGGEGRASVTLSPDSQPDKAKAPTGQ